MTQRRRIISGMRSLAGTITLVLFTAAASSAAEHGGGGHGGSFLDLIPYWVNFLLFVGVLYSLLRTPISNYWMQRREGIANAISSAAEQLRNAESTLRRAREDFDNVEEEIARVQEIISKEAQAEQEAVLADARRRAEVIAQRSRDTAASERIQAERTLRQELAERVITRARRRIVERMSPPADEFRRQAAVDAFKSVLRQ